MGPMGTHSELVELWRASPRVVVLTGAGISTDSGISDFRGPNGLWTRNPGAQAMFDIDTYMRDPEVRRRAWANRRENPAWTAEPNRGHHALAELQRSSHLGALMTQNIDGLHQRAGSTGVLELHGTIWEVACMSCGGPMAHPGRAGPPGARPTVRALRGHPQDRDDLVRPVPGPDVLDAAFTAADEADLLVAIGTSLQVNPVAGLAGVAGTLAIVNAEPTPYDDGAEVVVRDSISDVLDEVRRSLT